MSEYISNRQCEVYAAVYGKYTVTTGYNAAIHDKYILSIKAMNAMPEWAWSDGLSDRLKCIISKRQRLIRWSGLYEFFRFKVCHEKSSVLTGSMPGLTVEVDLTAAHELQSARAGP